MDGESGAYIIPKGIIQVIAKQKDPVWYKPDWLCEKEGQEPQLLKGPLGEYALFFDGGFVIHGKPAQGSPAMPMQHACIMLADDDLRVAYKLLAPGAIVYMK